MTDRKWLSNKTVRIESLTWDYGGGQKRTKSDDGWLTAIDKIYRCNSVGLISAKYCSDAKWCTQHSGIIYFFLYSFAEKVIKCCRLRTTVCPDGVFSCQRGFYSNSLKIIGKFWGSGHAKKWPLPFPFPPPRPPVKPRLRPTAEETHWVWLRFIFRKTHSGSLAGGGAIYIFIGEMSFWISENSSIRHFCLLQNEQNSSTVVKVSMYAAFCKRVKNYNRLQ